MDWRALLAFIIGVALAGPLAQATGPRAGSTLVALSDPEHCLLQLERRLASVVVPSDLVDLVGKLRKFYSVLEEISLYKLTLVTQLNLYQSGLLSQEQQPLFKALCRLYLANQILPAYADSCNPEEQRPGNIGVFIGRHPMVDMKVGAAQLCRSL